MSIFSAGIRIYAVIVSEFHYIFERKTTIVLATIE